MAKRKKPVAFPNDLYVVREQFNDGSSDLLLAADNVQEHAEVGVVRRVAVYKLVEVVDVSTEIKITDE
jgi:hypothetical protein